MKKKLLSILLCLCMVLGLLPTVTPPAAAAETKTVLDYIVWSNDTAIMRTDTTAVTNTQEVAIGGTPMLPHALYSSSLIRTKEATVVYQHCAGCGHLGARRSLRRHLH